jgi:uncharacterized protein YraI
MQSRQPAGGIGLALAVGAVLWLALAPVSGARGPRAQGTPAPEVWAEAIQQANVRSGPGLEYPVVGEIVAGTRYATLARHSVARWLQLAYGRGTAWVYEDLVTLTGDVASLPVTGEFPPLASLTPTPLLRATTTEAPAESVPDTTPESVPDQLAATDPPTPSLTPTLDGPTAVTLGEANVRFGPGVEYAPILQVPAGSTFRVLERHALYPWLHIAVPDAPEGHGWIFREIVEITGDLSSTPVTNATQFGFPTLTPTPPTVIVGGAPWDDAPPASGDLAASLGREMNTFLLEEGFAPYTDRLASVFLLDLASGDTFTLVDDVAFSGMSLTKIAVLATYFLRHQGPLSFDEAFLIADTMMCSENITSNQLLALIGEGDEQRGASRVTAFLQSLNLNGSFLLRSYLLNPDDELAPVGSVNTGVDQASARPDLSNQMLPRDLGWLLAGIYQCARDETGLLVERYPSEFTAQECRQMLRAMDANEIGVFIEAGVPAEATVMHKHGWIGDTHGDAAIVIGPDRAYVLVVALYGKDWLEFDLSAPVIGELSRMAWNTLNPSQLVPTVASRVVPDQCDPRQDPVLDALLAPNLPAPGP